MGRIFFLFHPFLHFTSSICTNLHPFPFLYNLIYGKCMFSSYNFHFTASSFQLFLPFPSSSSSTFSSFKTLLDSIIESKRVCMLNLSSKWWELSKWIQKISNFFTSHRMFDTFSYLSIESCSSIRNLIELDVVRWSC